MATMGGGKATLLIFLTFWLFSTLSIEVKRGTTTSSVSEEKEEEATPNKKLLNTSAIKTIRTRDGDVFDCIDIRKQPAFDHPLLKNHTIQMTPSSFPKEAYTTPSFTSHIKIELENGGCPIGTIPIQRLSRNGLLKVPSFANYEFNNTSNNHLLNTSIGNGLQWADMSTIRGKYYGTRALINVWGHDQLTGNQYSTGHLRLLNNVYGFENVNKIFVGWLIQPKFFGDSRTRLIVGWTRDNFKQTGCFNLECPGFVHVSHDVPIGGAISPLSTYNGTQYHINILVFQDTTTGDWWLNYGEDHKLVGYWPKSLFTGLAKAATQVHWGGFTDSYFDETGPPMGSGHFPYDGYSKASYFGQIQLVGGDAYLRDPKFGEQVRYVSLPRCYDLGPYHFGPMRYTFYYGGPGPCQIW